MTGVRRFVEALQNDASIGGASVDDILKELERSGAQVNWHGLASVARAEALRCVSPASSEHMAKVALRLYLHAGADRLPSNEDLRESMRLRVQMIVRHGARAGSAVLDPLPVAAWVGEAVSNARPFWPLAVGSSEAALLALRSAKNALRIAEPVFRAAPEIATCEIAEWRRIASELP